MDLKIEIWRPSRREMLATSLKLSAGGVIGIAATRLGRSGVLAAGTPVSTAYPELIATVTDEAISLSTDQIASGYVLMTVVNNGSASGSAGVIGPGPGKTMQDLMAAAAAATPEADSFLPSFFYDATFPGGPSEIAPGATGQAIILLAEGDWAVWGGSESTNPEPVFFTASGSAGDQAAPVADIAITEVDFAFGGFGQAIPAGAQTWSVTNQGTQPHMLSISQVPDGTTLAQVLAAVGGSDSATPEEGGLTRTDFTSRGGVILQSPGTTAWPRLDLPAGRYAALCFVGDPNHGYMPHAMEGMFAVFDVG